MVRPELLAPGGSFDGMRGALNAGADAVYMGGRLFGARAYADNPDDDGLVRAIDYCHTYGKKLYLTVNTLLKNSELEGQLYDWLYPLYRAGVDAVLVQDYGVLSFIREHFPLLPIHASTQMSIQSVEGAVLAKQIGCSRIVPARELSLPEIRKIVEKTGLEVECFVHGALCYCYSGQCLSSSLIGGRSGNRGRCAQTCRLPGKVAESRQKGLHYPMSLKDICTLAILPDLIDAGICSFKIEGRMKRPVYAAGVSAIYRRYIDLYLEKGRNGYHIEEKDMTALMDLYNRGGFSKGYYFPAKGPDMMASGRPNHAGTVAGTAVADRNRKQKGQQGLLLKAEEDLYRGDVLQDASLAGSSEKDQKKLLTLKEDVRKGGYYPLPPAMGLKQGSAVRRISSERLQDEIRHRYLDRDPQVKIKGNFILRAQRPAILDVYCGSAHFRAEGDVPDRATGEGLTKESILKQLQKTKDTPFVFDAADIDPEEGLFLPVSSLNRIRREALAGLQGEIIASGRRDTISAPVRETAGEKTENLTIKDNDDRKPRRHVLLSDPSLLAFVLSFDDVDRICLDTVYYLDHQERTPAGDIMAVKEAGKECMLVMPWIWREKTQRLFQKIFPEQVTALSDGYLIRLADQIPFCSEKAKRDNVILAADSSVYTWNTGAVRELSQLGLAEFTMSMELNHHELAGLADKRSELVVYGYQKIMITEQCLKKNTTACDGNPSWIYLQDRTGRKTRIATHCGICMNTVYNSEPLCLYDLSEKEKIFEQIGAVRYDFTTETKQQAGMILKGEERPLHYTRGHFYRGVE